MYPKKKKQKKQKNKRQEKVFIGGLKAVEIVCWKASKDQNWKAFTAKSIIKLLFYPMFPFKIILIGCPQFRSP